MNNVYKVLIILAIILPTATTIGYMERVNFMGKRIAAYRSQNKHLWTELNSTLEYVSFMMTHNKLEDYEVEVLKDSETLEIDLPNTYNLGSYGKLALIGNETDSVVIIYLSSLDKGVWFRPGDSIRAIYLLDE